MFDRFQKTPSRDRFQKNIKNETTKGNEKQQLLNTLLIN